MIISLNGDNNENLNINYGEWGIGILTPRSNELNVYDVTWTTTITYDFHAFGVESPDELPIITLHFVTSNELNFDLGSRQLGKPIAFIRDATIDTFPQIPWDPESCAP